MKKLLIFCFLISIFLSTTIGVDAARFMWSAGTTAEGTTSYLAIGTLSELVTTYAGNDIFMTPIGYTGSLAGLKGFDRKEVDSMYASTQQFDQIINKWGPFSPDTYKWTAPVSQFLWMYDFTFWFLIRKKDADKIKSWSDLANRPVYLQMRGSGTYELNKVMFGPEALNMWDTLDVKDFHYSHAADALKMKEVDAICGCAIGGLAGGWVNEVVTKNDCVLLVPSSKELQKIKNIDFISASEISPKEYGIFGLTNTAEAPALGYAYLVRQDLPEEIVYKAIKVIFEKAGEMSKTLPLWSKFSEDPWGFNLPYLIKYKKLGAPVHPGVLRYFKELGHDTKMLGLE